jgi:AGZA family xanthine/uracil permease-like MFS transporter
VAIAFGFIIYLGGFGLGNFFDLQLLRLHEPEVSARPGVLPLLPSAIWELDWWKQVWTTAVQYLPIAIPFGLVTVVGGIDCAESSASAGDEYDTRSVLLAQGLGTVVGGLCGGVAQPTPYFGHPAYKVMGARAAFTLTAALFLGLAGGFGWFLYLFEWLPHSIVFPIIVFVGLQTMAQSFQATPPRHYQAMVFASVPVVAYLILIPMNAIHKGQPPADGEGALTLMTLRCLANGFIITSLLWGGAFTALQDGQLRRSAIFLLVAAGFTLLGLIHSPLPNAPITFPHQVYEELLAAGQQFKRDPQFMLQIPFQYQSPYHWAAAYGLSAAALWFFSLFRIKPVTD